MQGKRLLVARFRALESAITARVRELEEKVADNDEMRDRYRRFIDATRALLDPESEEPARLLAEICLELELSPQGRRFPWVRRS